MIQVLPNKEDVRRLLEDPSAKTRVGLARKLGLGYTQKRLSADERRIANDILRKVARDVDQLVRRALSQTICLSPDLPPDVAMRLANDVADVAEPILTYSEILSDEALIEIVRGRSERHRLIIAGRQRLTASVSASLADHGDAVTAARLAANQGADIAEPSYERLIEKHGAVRSFAASLAERPELPLAVAERLVAMVSDRLRVRFAREGADAERLSGTVREGATLLLIGADAEQIDMMTLIDRLKASGRLFASLVEKAAMRGDWDLALGALARLGGEHPSNIRAVMTDPRTRMDLLRRSGQDEAAARRISERYEQAQADKKRAGAEAGPSLGDRD